MTETATPPLAPPATVATASLSVSPPGPPKSYLSVEPLDAAAIERVKRAALQSPEDRRVVRDETDALLDRQGDQSPAHHFRVAVGLAALGDWPTALEHFQLAAESADRRFQLGLVRRELGDFDAAIADLEAARKHGASADLCALEIVETHRRADRLDAADQLLSQHAHLADKSADWHYQKAQVLDRLGQHELALDEFLRSLQLDPAHKPSLFQMARRLDQRGENTEAIRLYRLCVAAPPLHVNALLNLALLLDETGRYQEAVECCDRVLESFPEHPRATLYRKDFLASTNMMYDEQEDKARLERNQLLEIPITDFELSVRSRNCLKKMNVRVLGDLLNISETELLAYKNFGETSLQEIKDMLTSKNLRLGQNVEEGVTMQRPTRPAPAPSAPDSVLATPVTEIEFSVRSKKCLQRLGVQTLGDLVVRTEPELLAIKNFGQTSLQEIKNKLAEYNLSLRPVDR